MVHCVRCVRVRCVRSDGWWCAGGQVLLSLELKSKKVKNKPLFRRGTPVLPKDEKKEAKEDKKHLKDFLKVTDTLEKELNALVAEDNVPFHRTTRTTQAPPHTHALICEVVDRRSVRRRWGFGR